MAQFLQPDNAVRKAAEARLKIFLRKPTAAGMLLQVTTASAFPEVRGGQWRPGWGPAARYGAPVLVRLPSLAPARAMGGWADCRAVGLPW